MLRNIIPGICGALLVGVGVWLGLLSSKINNCNCTDSAKDTLEVGHIYYFRDANCDTASFSLYHWHNADTVDKSDWDRYTISLANWHEEDDYVPISIDDIDRSWCGDSLMFMKYNYAPADSMMYSLFKDDYIFFDLDKYNK